MRGPRRSGRGCAGRRTGVAPAGRRSGHAGGGYQERVKQAVDLKNGGDSVLANEELINRIRPLDGTAWAVGRFDALVAQGRLPAGFAGQLPPIIFAGIFEVDNQENFYARAWDARTRNAPELCFGSRMRPDMAPPPPVLGPPNMAPAGPAYDADSARSPAATPCSYKRRDSLRLFVCSARRL